MRCRSGLRKTPPNLTGHRRDGERSLANVWAKPPLAVAFQLNRYAHNARAVLSPCVPASRTKAFPLKTIRGLHKSDVDYVSPLDFVSFSFLCSRGRTRCHHGKREGHCGCHSTSPSSSIDSFVHPLPYVASFHQDVTSKAFVVNSE